MRTYCVILIACILLAPLAEVRASEATMVASLTITERPVAENHETIVILPQANDAAQLAVVWGAPSVTVHARAQDGGVFEQAAVVDKTVDLSTMGQVQELSVY